MNTNIIKFSAREIIIILIMLMANSKVIAQNNDLKILTVNNYSETAAKKYFDSKKIDPIEGIWMSSEGYKLSIEKKLEKGIRLRKKYQVVILSCNYKSDMWRPSYIKAFIEKTAGVDIYYVDYYTAGLDAVEIQTCKGVLNENGSLFSFTMEKRATLISWAKIYPEVENNTVKIEDILYSGFGTGIVFSTDGYIATCLHVVNHSKKINIRGLNGDFKNQYKAEIVIADEQYDLAILKIHDHSFKQLQSLPFSISTSIAEEGEDVFTLGFSNIKSLPEKAIVSNGIITATKGVHGDNSSYRISVPIDQGDSGGALFDSKGNVIGIVNMKISEAENVGYAIKTCKLKKLFEMHDKKSVFDMNKNTVYNKSLHEKEKILSNYTCIVEVNDFFDIYSISKSMNILSSTISEEDNEKDPDSYYSLAYFQIQLKQFDSAYSNFSKAIAKGLNNPTAYYLRGYLGAYLKKDAVLVINDFKKYLENDSLATANLYFNRGDAYSMLGMKDSAIADYSKCIEKDSTMLEAYLKRGELLCSAGICEKAIKDLNKVIDAIKKSGKKSFAKIYLWKGECLLKLNRFEDALECAKTVLDIDGADVEGWTLTGKIYFSLKKYELCITTLTKAINIEENEASYLWRGKAKIEMGKNADGKKDIDKSNELANNTKEKK